VEGRRNELKQALREMKQQEAGFIKEVQDLTLEIEETRKDLNDKKME